MPTDHQHVRLNILWSVAEKYVESAKLFCCHKCYFLCYNALVKLTVFAG
jgi:hypothetical protein